MNDWEASKRRAGASRSTPLAIVSSAVAGGGIERVARSASEALGHPVAIILPSVGAPVVWPAGALEADVLAELAGYAAAVTDGSAAAELPVAVAHVEPIRIGREVVGIVATTGGGLGGGSRGGGSRGGGSRGNGAGDGPSDWLEATAAAAAVTRLMDDGPNGGPDGVPDGEEADVARALLSALAAGPPAQTAAVVADGRRLGVDLSAGAIAVCGRGPADAVPALEGAVVAELDSGHTVGLVSLADERTGERQAAALADQLTVAGVSAPRRQPALLHEALREAMLLAELAGAPEAAFAGQEETHRLLIGVLLRDRLELEQLRASTISPLLAYDAEHDTELLITLATFLAHHGSTTETAEAMRLHRHTVGYRLSRVQEVSGLSPYESDGRERLSLGLKAAQILAAEERLSQPG